jgi:hypothetical protein
MGVITSGSFAKALLPGVKAWYGRAYNEWQKEYPDLFELQKSTRAWEEEVGVTGFGLAAIKPEGHGIAYDENSQGWINRYTHVVYALGFIITREMYDDNLYDTIALRRAKALAFSIRQTKEIVGANVLNRAFNSSYKGGDGVEMCSDVHPNKSGGTWSNELSTPADLSEGALEQACIDIANFTTDRGLKIAISPQSLHVANGPNMFESERILSNPNRPDTANRDINAIYSLKMFPKGVKVNHYFTDADAWFIKTNCPDGLKYMERRKDDFDTDNDFPTENALFKATSRYSFGWTDPRNIFGSPGA